jgi:nicotinate-nucleotide adenylyltransferase
MNEPWIETDATMRLGLMGGTFDPVHVGHLVIAEAAREEFRLDQVVWIPAGDPPHKDRKVSDQEHRYAMAVLATASHPDFVVSRLELEREGPSYALDTIRHFRKQVKPQELFFITGADAILEILTWHRHDEVIRQCRFVAATRPGYDLGRLRRLLPDAYMDRIHVFSAPEVDVSSTGIREKLAAGRSVRYLVPEPVEQYLTKHRLYQSRASPDGGAGRAQRG